MEENVKKSEFKEENKVNLEIKKTRKKICVLFVLGVIVVLLPIVFVLYVITHFSIIHPT